jgi:hypothetical protein
MGNAAHLWSLRPTWWKERINTGVQQSQICKRINVRYWAWERSTGAWRWSLGIVTIIWCHWPCLSLRIGLILAFRERNSTEFEGGGNLINERLFTFKSITCLLLSLMIICIKLCQTEGCLWHCWDRLSLTIVVDVILIFRSGQEMVVHTFDFHHSRGRGRWIFEFEASLVYRASARPIPRNFLSQRKKKICVHSCQSWFLTKLRDQECSSVGRIINIISDLIFKISINRRKQKIFCVRSVHIHSVPCAGQRSKWDISMGLHIFQTRTFIEPGACQLS